MASETLACNSFKAGSSQHVISWSQNQLGRRLASFCVQQRSIASSSSALSASRCACIVAVSVMVARAADTGVSAPAAASDNNNTRIVIIRVLASEEELRFIYTIAAIRSSIKPNPSLPAVFKPSAPPRQKMNIKVANKLEKVIDRILTVMGSVFINTGDSVQFRTNLSNASPINIPLLQHYGTAIINTYSYLEFTNVSCHFYVQSDTYADSLNPSRIREIKDLFMDEAMKQTYATSDRIFIEADFERCQDEKNIVRIYKFGSLKLNPPLALKQTS